MVNIISFIVIGIIAGWLASLLMRGHGLGLLGDLLVGIIGAVIGGMMFDFLGIESGGLIGSLVMATIGAVVLLFVVGLFRRGTHHPTPV